MTVAGLIETFDGAMLYALETVIGHGESYRSSSSSRITSNYRETVAYGNRVISNGMVKWLINDDLEFFYIVQVSY